MIFPIVDYLNHAIRRLIPDFYPPSLNLYEASRFIPHRMDADGSVSRSKMWSGPTWRRETITGV